jgi:rubrerythrin
MEKQKKETNLVIDQEKEVTQEELDDDLSELLEAIEKDEIDEDIENNLLSEEDENIDDLKDDEESDEYENTRKIKTLLKQPRKKASHYKTSASRSLNVGYDDSTDETPKLKSRWLLTTCRYCGTMYRFRTDEPQPPNCGKPQCVERFKEASKGQIITKPI